MNSLKSSFSENITLRCGGTPSKLFDLVSSRDSIHAKVLPNQPPGRGRNGISKEKKKANLFLAYAHESAIKDLSQMASDPSTGVLERELMRLLEEEHGTGE